MRDHRVLPFPSRRFEGPDDAPKALIECCDPALAWAAADVLAEEGYAVATCWALGAGPQTPCPLLVGERCPLLAEADLIVRSFAGREADHRPIAEAVSRAAPRTPVTIESPDGRGWFTLGPGMISTRLAEAAERSVSRESG